MAARDIMPFKSTMGGHCEIRWAAMTSGELFEIGEPVAIVNAGTLTEPPDNADQIILADDMDGGLRGGIAAFGPGGGNLNPQTGVNFTAGDMIAYYPWGQGNTFITKKFHGAGGTTTAVPALTDIGEPYQITYNTTAGSNLGWGVEQTAGVFGTNLVAVVVDVLDSNYVSINEISSNGTGVYVVFEIKTAA